MNIKDIQLLFAYNDWANKRILAKAEQVSEDQLRMPSGFGWGSLFGGLVHLMDAEYGWRMLLKDGIFIEELTPADFPDLAALKARWQRENRALREYLDSLSDEDVSGIISYEVEGKLRQRVLWRCLVHVVNHGTQHRSECAAMLTDFGHSPGDLDLALFLWARDQAG